MKETFKPKSTSSPVSNKTHRAAYMPCVPLKAQSVEALSSGEPHLDLSIVYHKRRSLTTCSMRLRPSKYGG